jgi:DNA mismatch endonuclease, patch repair protein
MDIVSSKVRSRMMSGIRGKSTKPELTVRRAAHAMGLRFRLHRRDLPGSPDLVFPRLRKIVFVHGCFWHRHAGCRFAYTPRSNATFWLEKLKANVRRDSAAQAALCETGWDVLVIWECEVDDGKTLSRKLKSFLVGSTSRPLAIPSSEPRSRLHD